MLSYEITKSLSFFCVHSVIVMILCLQMCMPRVCGRLLWLSSIIMTATEEHERGTNTIYRYSTQKERKYKVKSGGMSFVWLIISHPHSFISAFSHFFLFFSLTAMVSAFLMLLSFLLNCILVQFHFMLATSGFVPLRFRFVYTLVIFPSPFCIFVSILFWCRWC